MQNLKPLTAAVLAIGLSCAAYASPGSAGGGRSGGGAAARLAGGGEFFGGSGSQFGGRPAGPRLAGHRSSHGDDRARANADGPKADYRNANPRAAVAQRLLNSHAMAGALHDKDALRDPSARAGIAATAAIAGRHDRDEHGWWRHPHRPLFWFFAHDDVYDYGGDGDDDYGYDDIYAEIFIPYGHDDRIGHLPPGGATGHTRQASRTTADPVASPAAADRAASQATAHPATSKAAAHPATSKPTAHRTMSQAAAQPATSNAAGHPAALQAAAQPAMSKATDHPAASQAAAQPAAPQPPRRPATGPLAQPCSEDSRDIAGLPIDRFQRAIAPDETQLAALDDLGNASMKAAQDIRAGCPTQIPATAPARLAVMQQLVEAMITAVGTVQPALDKFYGLLNDGQKASLNGIGPNQRSKSAAKGSGGALARNCLSGQPGTTDWPIAEIEAKLHLTDTQRANLAALIDASAKASEMLKEACRPDDALTPPARLAATGKRLEVMRLAIKTVLAELDDFYDQLTEEQKAQFEAIRPGTAAPSGEAEAGEQTPAPVRRLHGRHRAGIGSGTI